MSIEEKYGVQTVKKSKKKGEGTHKPQVKCSRNVFDDVNLESNFGKNSISKMVVIDANDSDNEIIIQKTVQKQYLGQVQDEKTGSMMPVMYQLEFDGTKSKITGSRVSHTPDIGGDGDAVHGRNLKSNSISDRKKAKRNKLDKIDSDLEIVDEVPGDDELDTKLVLEVDTGIASSDDDLDVDLNNNAEKPQMTNQTVQEKSVPSHKIVIKKCKKEQKPIDVVVSKNEVISDIPTLEHGVPKGKAGKDHRILSNEIRENEQALLQMLKEVNDLSTESSDSSEIERKRVEKCKKDRKIKRSLKSIKSKLAEE